MQPRATSLHSEATEGVPAARNSRRCGDYIRLPPPLCPRQPTCAGGRSVRPHGDGRERLAALRPLTFINVSHSSAVSASPRSIIVSRNSAREAGGRGQETQAGMRTPGA